MPPKEKGRVWAGKGRVWAGKAHRQKFGGNCCLQKKGAPKEVWLRKTASTGLEVTDHSQKKRGAANSSHTPFIWENTCISQPVTVQ